MLSNSLIQILLKFLIITEIITDSNVYSKNRKHSTGTNYLIGIIPRNEFKKDEFNYTKIWTNDIEPNIFLVINELFSNFHNRQKRCNNMNNKSAHSSNQKSYEKNGKKIPTRRNVIRDYYLIKHPGIKNESENNITRNLGPSQDINGKYYNILKRLTGKYNRYKNETNSKILDDLHGEISSSTNIYFPLTTLQKSKKKKLNSFFKNHTAVNATPMPFLKFTKPSVKQPTKNSSPFNNIFSNAVINNTADLSSELYESPANTTFKSNPTEFINSKCFLLSMFTNADLLSNLSKHINLSEPFHPSSNVNVHVNDVDFKIRNSRKSSLTHQQKTKQLSSPFPTVKDKNKFKYIRNNKTNQFSRKLFTSVSNSTKSHKNRTTDIIENCNRNNFNSINLSTNSSTTAINDKNTFLNLDQSVALWKNISGNYSQSYTEQNSYFKKQNEHHKNLILPMNPNDNWKVSKNNEYILDKLISNIRFENNNNNNNNISLNEAIQQKNSLSNMHDFIDFLQSISENDNKILTTSVDTFRNDKTYGFENVYKYTEMMRGSTENVLSNFYKIETNSTKKLQNGVISTNASIENTSANNSLKINDMSSIEISPEYELLISLPQNLSKIERNNFKLSAIKHWNTLCNNKLNIAAVKQYLENIFISIILPYAYSIKIENISSKNSQNEPKNLSLFKKYDFQSLQSSNNKSYEQEQFVKYYNIFLINENNTEVIKYLLESLDKKCREIIMSNRTSNNFNHDNLFSFKNDYQSESTANQNENAILMDPRQFRRRNSKITTEKTDIYEKLIENQFSFIDPITIREFLDTYKRYSRHKKDETNNTADRSATVRRSEEQPIKEFFENVLKELFSFRKILPTPLIKRGNSF